jgi:glycerol kinase
MTRYVMAIDQGTTGTRVMITDDQGEILCNAYEEFPQIYPQPGWVEHDPEVIWETTQVLLKKALSETGLPASKIQGIGITNQRETTVLWDRDTLKPVHNAIVWQCRRSAAICDELRSKGLEKIFQEKTGLLIDAYFSGTKVKWILDRDADLKRRAQEGKICFGTIDAWLVAKLTGGRVHATDYTNASRTLMFNIHEKKWDAELLDILDIPVQMLPDVVASSGVLAETDADLLGTPVPIAGIAGDQQAALFGQGCFAAGEAKNTYGTGCFMLLNIADQKIDPAGGLVLTLACDGAGNPCYALEGSVFIGGAVVQWLRDGLELISDAAETQAIAESVPDTHGVYLVPAFAGLGAPYWDMYARGGILGITRGAKRAHIVRAALEGIAFQVKDLAGAFEKTTGIAFRELRVDGGACRNDFLMQFQADILGCPVDRSHYIESTGMGAAFLAGLATGCWKTAADILELRKSEKRFSPMLSPTEREAKYAGWLDVVERVKSHAEPPPEA